MGAFDYEGKPGRDVPGVRNLGQDGHSLPKDIFEDEVRKSLAIVGVFDPVISPTPWYGLCWGLPFINPGNYRYDASGALEHISDSQHEFAALEGEPHVHSSSSVKRRNAISLTDLQLVRLPALSISGLQRQPRGRRGVHRRPPTSPLQPPGALHPSTHDGARAQRPDRSLGRYRLWAPPTRCPSPGRYWRSSQAFAGQGATSLGSLLRMDSTDTLALDALLQGVFLNTSVRK